jgi:predicted nucleic acid-binding protein
MGSLSSLTEARTFLVADASVVINLNASGCAQEVLEALTLNLKVVDVVPGELEEGRHRQRQDAALLEKLAVSGHVEIVQLDETGQTYFEQLVAGPAQTTLDDGEAATIAYGVARGGVVVIDEVKANRICAQCFPNLQLACSVDIIAHPAVGNALGSKALSDAVFKALFEGRMRVFPRHLDWVVDLIGCERARLCSSLPGSVRAPQQSAIKRTTKAG